ncbi:type II secretion system protein [bacterium]|nr:type II secretion system protein [bacterium]
MIKNSSSRVDFSLPEKLDCQFAGRRKTAFTLAEVLITIGIIGIVAAMTLPALITKHQKKVVATRVKQFSSIWQQARKLAADEQGTDSFFGTLVAKDPDSAFDFYNETFGKYIRTIKVEKSQFGITGAMQNGSGFYFYRTTGQSEGSAYTYLIFCPYYKDCKQLADSGRVESSEGLSDGKKTFGFYTKGSAPNAHWDGTREWLLESCTTGGRKGYCTTLIQYDGWEIKDDYPW